MTSNPDEEDEDYEDKYFYNKELFNDMQISDDTPAVVSNLHNQ